MKASKLFIILVGLIIFGSTTNVVAQINTAFSGNGTPTTTINGSGNNAFGGGALTSLTNGNQNVAIGNVALNAATTAIRSVAVGNESLNRNTTGNDNTAIGQASSSNNTTGSNNVAVGRGSLFLNASGNNNVALGFSSGQSLIGSNNTCIGTQSAFNLSTGEYNTIIGSLSANGLLSGSCNTIIGRAAGFTRAANNPLNNTIIIADGGIPGFPGSNGTQRLYIDNNGNAGFGLGNFIVPKNRLDIAGGVAIGTTYASGIIDPLNPTSGGTVAPTSGLIVQGNTGIGTNAPSTRLDVNAAVTGTSGLRLRNLPNNQSALNSLTTSATKKVLSVDGNGVVVLVDGGGVTNSCTGAANVNFVTKTIDASGNLGCSQIFDNGTSVGIGNTGTFDYTVNPGAGDFSVGINPGGTAKLKVSGTTWSTGFYATSDKNFKKELKLIESPLEKIQKLEGKTYLWNKEENKEMGFDTGLHSGFIAQELEKVLPHLVATGSDGSKAVNYMELMPYLVEAIKEQQNQIKEQQSQINELKEQLSNNFKSQNNDLIKFENTKIINVSPNPSNDVITVSLNIEKGIQSAKLMVHDLNGTVLSSLNINERDTNIAKTLQKDNFGKGIYIVDLVINGKSIDTKKIVFN